MDEADLSAKNLDNEAARVLDPCLEVCDVLHLQFIIAVSKPAPGFYFPASLSNIKMITEDPVKSIKDYRLTVEIRSL
jgi:hypothetical protein